MTHPQTTLRSTTRTSLKGTEGKQRSLSLPIVVDLVKAAGRGTVAVSLRPLFCGWDHITEEQGGGPFHTRPNPLTPLKVLSWGFGVESSLPSPLFPIH